MKTNRDTLNNNIKWLVHTVVCALYIAIAFTWADFHDMPFATTKETIITLFHWGTIAFVLWALMMLLSLLGKWAFSVVYSILAFCSSVLTYFRYELNFSLNATMIDVALNNDIATSSDLITPWLVIIAIIGTAAAFFIAYQRRLYTINFKHYTTYCLLIPIVLVAIFLSCKFTKYIASCIPFNIVAVTNEYLADRKEIATIRPRLSQYAIANDDSTTVVVVIGESLRPSSMSINGYHRKTTPKLENHKIISFDNIWTDYYYTNESVAHMLTRSNDANPERAYSERSFIDVFNQADIPTAAILNQDLEKQYIYMMNEADTVIEINSGRWNYNFNKRLDEDLIPYYTDMLNRNPQQLIVLHTIGSHWWYPIHHSSDFEYFKPVVKSRMLSECDSVSMVNSYDNTVLYTDHVLSQMIELLSDRKAILLYLSDHGEPLGEDGCWLHSFEVEITHHTASFVWMSESYREAHPERYEAVVANRHHRFKTDYLYHTTIEAANIDCDLLDTTRSLFHKTQTPR